MALTQCLECNAEISSEAAWCPRCGHPSGTANNTTPPPKAKSGQGPLLLLLILGVVVMVGLVGNDQPQKSVTDTQITTQQLDRTPSMQKKRKAFIDKLIAQKVISKVEVPGNLPRAWVKPAFYALDFDAKKAFCNAILTYYYAQDDRMDILKLLDAKTNKEVGKFTFPDGSLTLE